MKTIKNEWYGKELKLITIGIMLSMCLSTNFAQSQSISTKGSIYDYHVGDLFHFDYAAGDGMGEGIHSITNIEILERYYSFTEDTVFYVRDIAYQESSSWSPNWEFDFYVDTIYYFNLDSLVNFGDIDSVYTNSTLYNGRIINSIESLSPEDTWALKFVEGCGKVWDHYESFSSNGESLTQLVYYKKGEDEWGSPLVVSVKNSKISDAQIAVYPNPATDILNIEYQAPKVNLGRTIEIYNSQGVKVEELVIPKTKESISINCMDWQKGLYLVRLDAEGTNVKTTKFIKN